MQKHLLSVSHRPDRENDSRHSRRDSSAADGSERGALPLPEPAVRTPAPGGEVRRPEGGDGSLLGEKNTTRKFGTKKEIYSCNCEQNIIHL